MSHFGRNGPPDIVDTYSLLVLNVRRRMICSLTSTSMEKLWTFLSPRIGGKLVDGREIMVQFAKYGPNAEKISKGRIIEKVLRTSISRSRSPRRRSRDDYYGDRDYSRRRSRSRSYDRYDRDRYGERERGYRCRSLSRSASSDYGRSRSRGRYGDERRRSRSRSSSYESASPPRGRKSLSPHRSVSPDRRSRTPRSVSPRHGPADSRSPSLHDNE